MHSRNPYWESLRAVAGLSRTNVYADEETEAHSGRWRERFPVEAFPVIQRQKGIAGGLVEAAPAGVAALRFSGRPSLHVEVGCNTGHVSSERAARAPSELWIGVDWKHKIVFRAAEKAGKRRLANLIFLRAHAERLGFVFGPGELDSISVYFPDPWPKKAHWKNRYLTAERFRTFARVLRPGGLLHLKTDHLGYFEWMEAALAENPGLWIVRERTRDLHAGVLEPLRLEIPEVTLFEKLFIRDGIPIQSLKLERQV